MSCFQSFTEIIIAKRTLHFLNFFNNKPLNQTAVIRHNNIIALYTALKAALVSNSIQETVRLCGLSKW